MPLHSVGCGGTSGGGATRTAGVNDASARGSSGGCEPHLLLLECLHMARDLRAGDRADAAVAGPPHALPLLLLLLLLSLLLLLLLGMVL